LAKGLHWPGVFLCCRLSAGASIACSVGPNSGALVVPSQSAVRLVGGLEINL
jgi:hypothetical protein